VQKKYAEKMKVHTQRKAHKLLSLSAHLTVRALLSFNYCLHGWVLWYYEYLK